MNKTPSVLDFKYSNIALYNSAFVVIDGTVVKTRNDIRDAAEIVNMAQSGSSEIITI